ncbi:hypothetical protein B9X63_11875 [Acinetobacter baumannii]|nr:hypothetical protein BTG63_09925 [Acinetobacter baumannii]OTL76282.1 hypothetical protein B9X63_11875 [Acinetobacter baumannii]
MCRLLHLKIISLKKPLQIGLCNKAIYIPTCKFKVGVIYSLFQSTIFIPLVEYSSQRVNSLFKVDDINLIMNHASVSNLINVNIKYI